MKQRVQNLKKIRVIGDRVIVADTDGLEWNIDLGIYQNLMFGGGKGFPKINVDASKRLNELYNKFIENPSNQKLVIDMIETFSGDKIENLFEVYND